MNYELTFLLNEEAEIAKLKELLVTLKVDLLKEESWGKKRLSYPIKKHTTAVFYTWSLKADKKTIMELRKKLNYNEKLIRYLLLVVE